MVMTVGNWCGARSAFQCAHPHSDAHFGDGQYRHNRGDAWSGGLVHCLNDRCSRDGTSDCLFGWKHCIRGSREPCSTADLAWQQNPARGAAKSLCAQPILAIADEVIE
jgi:hypothetical protein